MPKPGVTNLDVRESSPNCLGLLLGAIEFGLMIFFLYYFSAPILSKAFELWVPSINVPE